VDKAVLGRRPIALVVGVRKRLLFLSACFFQASMISCGLYEDARGLGGQPDTHAMASPVVAAI